MVAKYVPATNFTSFSTSYPAAQQSGASMDAEFNAIKRATDATIDSLALIQRADGELANQSVGIDQLKTEVVLGFNAPTTWVTATAYHEADTVWYSNAVYRCDVSHTSGVFATDLAAGKWELVLDLEQFDNFRTAGFYTTFGGTDRVKISTTGENVVDYVGQGNSKTTSIHLNPGNGTVSTGTITEFVLHGTADQSFGGNYGRWSFTYLGTGNSNQTGLFGEYGGTVLPGPFVFQCAIENPSSAFTTQEFFRALSDTLSGSDQGCMLFGVNDKVQKNKIQLYCASPTVAGTADSNAIEFVGKATPDAVTIHSANWRIFSHPTSNSGASSMLIQQNIDNGSWTTRGSLSDVGLFTAASESITGAATIGGAATLQSTLAVTGNATLSGTASITGAATIAGAITGSTTIHVVGASSLDGAITAGATLAVTGASTLSGAITGSATIHVVGAASLDGAITGGSTLALTGNATISGAETVTGAVTHSSTMNNVGAATIGGAATLSSTLAVTGATTITGAVTHSSTMINAGAATITGAATLSSTLAVSGAATVTGALAANTSVATPSLTINSGTALTVYEEGSFTPTLIGTSTAGTQTYTAQVGRYTRIGNVVHISGFVQISNKSGMVGSAAIGGLPYAGSSVSNIEQAIAPGRINSVDFDAGYSQLTMRLGGGDTIIRLEEAGDNVASASIAVANIATTTFISFGGSYRV